MKISNLNTVKKLVDMLDGISKARVDIDRMVDQYNKDGSDSGGLPEHGFDQGYMVRMAIFGDGSGPVANMSGLYIGKEVCEAVKEVLDSRESLIVNVLESDYGVDVEV